MKKKRIIAMILAGGQGTRLKELTEDIAKPAVAFGGKYRIIDFTLTNCSNSGIDTVGVLTQYEPRILNNHIGRGSPWDLDRMEEESQYYNLIQEKMMKKVGIKEQLMLFIKI